MYVYTFQKIHHSKSTHYIFPFDMHIIQSNENPMLAKTFKVNLIILCQAKPYPTSYLDIPFIYNFAFYTAVTLRCWLRQNSYSIMFAILDKNVSSYHCFCHLHASTSVSLSCCTAYYANTLTSTTSVEWKAKIQCHKCEKAKSLGIVSDDPLGKFPS